MRKSTGHHQPDQPLEKMTKKVVGLTEIQGCLSASAAVILLAGLMVSILLMRSLASGVTVSHSGEGNCHPGGGSPRGKMRRKEKTDKSW